MLSSKYDTEWLPFFRTNIAPLRETGSKKEACFMSLLLSKIYYVHPWNEVYVCTLSKGGIAIREEGCHSRKYAGN